MSARLRPRLRLLATIVVSLPCALAAQGASAAPTTTGFALNRYHPAGPGSDWFAADSLDFRGKIRPALGIIADFSDRPLVIRDAAGDELDPIVGNQLYYHVSSSLVLTERLRLGASLPVLLHTQGGSGILAEAAGVQNVPIASSEGAGVGDARLSADVRLAGSAQRGLALSLGARVFIALGQEEHFASDGRARVEGRVAFAGRRGLFVHAGHVGLMVHSDRDDFAAIPFGADLTFGAAAGLRLLEGRITLGPEVYGSTVVSDSGSGFFERATTPVELLFGAKAHVADAVRLGAAVGAGLTSALGSPALRVLASFEWQASLGSQPSAPAPLEPPRDFDGDGVLDEVDVCPGTAGPARPVEPARTGCPDPVDSDGDGLPDVDDACPDDSGPASAEPVRHGCPVVDGDRDGIVDSVDACPERAGVQHPELRRNGCPADSDGDGILDLDDACAGAAGAASDDPKAHGCPKARIESGEIKIGEQVRFALASRTILPESDDLLAAVMQILLDHPEIELVSVEGHTDATGPAPLNLQLSRERAAAVVEWLAARGVARRRLTSRGLGPERPIATNDTEAGRRNNRRVEFRILRARPSAAAEPALVESGGAR